MKKIKLALIFAVIGIFVTFAHINAEKILAVCMTISGSVQLVSGQWPAGYSGIEVACAGDNPPGPSSCTGGGPQKVMPGQSFSFPSCSCWAGECLSIASASLPPGCTWSGNTNFCGANGFTTLAPIKISCPTPPPACPPGANFCGNSTGSNVSCPPGQIPDWYENKGYDDWCELPTNGGGSRPYCYRCIPGPTKTPTLTPTPTKPFDPCLGGGCITPITTPTSSPKVTPTIPKSTPTPSKPVSTVTPTSTPKATSTPRPTNTPVPTSTPIPTPTPDFNNAMCKCDQMNVGQITLGQPIQVEAFAKVEGQDTSKAVVNGMKFRIYEGNASAGRVRELPEKGNQPVTVVEPTTPTLVRYRAEWTASPELKVGEEYRLVATPDCAVKTAFIQSQQQRVVLAERDENLRFFEQVRNFFAGLFGGGSEPEKDGVQIQEENSGPLSFITNFFAPQQNQRKRDQLQLETFTPAQMEKEACNIVKFKFEFIDP